RLPDPDPLGPLFSCSFPSTGPSALFTLSLHDALPICVVLYDADRIEEAASVEDPKDLYPAQLGVFLDPYDTAVQEQARRDGVPRSEEHTSELQSRENLVCRLLLEKKKT